MGGTDTIRKGYHNLLRPEILELIPSTAKSILDLGCGTGELGKALKQRQYCEVDGIELNKEAAHIAEKYLDEVWIDNLNRFDPSFLTRKYDAIIFADILEHLINPWEVLHKFTRALSENGVVIASLPNIGHPYIRSQIQKGLFRYEPAGILDITHLRFFTKTTICQMLYRAGLKVTKLRPYPSDTNPIQYHVTALRPLETPVRPICTILILTLNAWRYTAMCINSIKARTSAPHKILVIDNGSTDGTVKELRNDLSIYHIENSSNLGFAAGFNVGLPLIDTPYFVICNSDIVVTKNWLSRMIKHIETDKKLVCLGPMTNNVSGPQLINEITYTDEKSLADFAFNLSQRTWNQLTYHQRIVFFCTLFKTSVLADIGFLDEVFEIGNFEDDDYCRRIALKGLKAAYDNTIFIHHYGSQSFKANSIDYKEIMETNLQRFKKKWGIEDKR